MSRFEFDREFDDVRREDVLNLFEIPDKDTYINLEMARRVATSDDMRQATALAIRDADADIIALQEVESIDILKNFEKYYLHRLVDMDYPWKRLIEGNDRRGIDVAALARRDTAISARSHKNLTFDDIGVFNEELNLVGINRSDPVFRRDCLELETEVNDGVVTIYVCHFKSMGFRRVPGIPYPSGVSSRDLTMPIREAEARAVRFLIETKFGANKAKDAHWVICGDLNDYIWLNGRKVSPSGIDPLLEDGFSFNVIDNLPAKERWTHYYPKDNHVSQLDYILLSPALAKANKDVKPDIIRKGMPFRVPGLENVERYPRIGFARPKASDHCPLAVTLKIPRLP